MGFREAHHAAARAGVEPPFSVAEWIEMYKNNKFEVLGYKILGPGSDESWLYSKDQAAPSSVIDHPVNLAGSFRVLKCAVVSRFRIRSAAAIFKTELW